MLVRIETETLISSIGSDKKGVQNFLIFGQSYPNKGTDEEKQAVKSKIAIVIQYISNTSNYAITYFHHGCGWKSKGAIVDLKKLFPKLPTEKQSRLSQLNMISLSFYVKMKISGLKLTSSSLLIKKLKKYDTIYAFMETIKSETVLS